MNTSALEKGISHATEAFRGLKIPAPTLKGVISNPINYLRLTLAAGVGLGLVNCTNQDINPATVTQEPNKTTATATADNQPTPTATISLTPGGRGGSEPIPTFPAGDSRESENPAIIEANRKADEEAAQKKSAPPEVTPGPEVQKPCKILPDKYCNGRLVEKEIINPLNQEKVIMRYVEFDIKEVGVEIYSPIAGQAGSVPRSDTNDFIVSVKNLQDPGRLTYAISGGIIPNPGNVNAGGIIGKSDGRPINFWVSSINGKELAYPLDKLQEVVPSIAGQKTKISQGPAISTGPALLVDRFQ